ncbi:hypothetical protein lbkm_1760 [Lachnospiraceae bacterium KM106-2]|nr:hypothetical protein lbkm_1760 [Lachnospiraceae bacterium KM106-2]
MEDFKNDKMENEDFWIQMRDASVLIRYFAERMRRVSIWVY